MRRDDEATLTRLEPREITKGLHALRRAREIQEQHVTAFDRPLDARNQQPAS